MKAIPLTRCASFSPFVGILERGGASVHALLRHERIDSELFLNPEEVLPLQRASSFIDHAARREGVEDLGLQAGAATPITSLGLFGAVIGNSLSLNDVIRNLVRWVPALNSGARVQLKQVEKDVMELRLSQQAEEGRPQVDAYALMLLIDAVRLAKGPNWRPREIALNSSVAGGSVRHEALSEATVDGNVNYVAFRFSRRSLSAPVRALERTTDRRAEALLKSTSPALDFRGSISQAIRSMLGIEAPTIEVAAGISGTSARTLQRRLAGNGLTYAKLLDQVRFTKATEMLEDPSIRLCEIAYRLGYSAPPNFTRAFRRWTGTSPQAFRQAHLPAFA